MLIGDERIDKLMRYDLEIIQSPSVFSFSLDAVLLQNFAEVPNHNRSKIVDLCSGNGVIPLALSTKTPSKIIGVELQSRLAGMARRSVELNGLEDQIEVIQADVRTITNEIAADSVDIVTCNPPYFPVSKSSRKNPNDHLAIARHELHLTLEETINATGALLKTNGKAFFVYRPNRLMEMLDLFRKYRLTPKAIQFIYPRRDLESNMILVKVIKDGKEEGLKVLPPVYVHDENGYTEEVSRLYYG